MNTQLVTSNVRLMQWRGIIQERIQSGLTVDEYCERRNLSRNAYYYWLRRIKIATIENCSDRFVELLPQKSDPVQIPSNRDEDFIPAAVIRLGNTTVSVKDGISRELLSLLVEVIGHAE